MLTRLWILAVLAAPALAQSPGELEPDGYYFRDPNATRHFYSPTAFMPSQGELSLSQNLLTSLTYGVTDGLSVTAGTILPLWGLGVLNVVGALKLGGRLDEMVHAAVGVQALGLMYGSSVSGGFVPYATITFGTPRLNATFSVGNLFPPSPLTLDPVLAFGVTYRVSPHVVLVTEHWLLPLDPFLGSLLRELPMFNGAGVRLMNEHWAVDLGLVRIPNAPPVLPWLNVAYTFGP